MEAIRPPAIRAFLLRIQIPKAVRKSGLQQFGHLCTFFIRETCIFPIGFRIFQVNFFVCHVQIAANNHRLERVQLFYIVAEVIFPLHAIIQSFQLALCIGRVAGHKIKVLILCRDNAPLVVMCVHTHATHHFDWLLPRKQRRAAVSLFLCTVPVFVIALTSHLCLSRLHFGLLQAEYVGVQCIKNVLKALAQAGPQTVDIP